MLINSDIKKILYKDKEITEIKYMDKTVWSSNDDVIGAPGNRKLLAGTMQAGWFGEVSANDFITGDALAKLVGITAGVSQYSDEPWLKFAYKGDVYLVAKKPIRCAISWDNINAANCVYGDKTIEISSRKYKIMLMRGIGEDVQPNPKTFYQPCDGAANHQSMWNMLMLPIHQKAPSSWAYPNNVKSPTENWGIGYTDADLMSNSTLGGGSYCWCQEIVHEASAHSMRGSSGISGATWNNSNLSYFNYGWRPCLQLIG